MSAGNTYFCIGICGMWTVSLFYTFNLVELIFVIVAVGLLNHLTDKFLEK